MFYLENTITWSQYSLGKLSNMLRSRSLGEPEGCLREMTGFKPLGIKPES